MLARAFYRIPYRRSRNLPFDAASIDSVVLSHAHIDHSGYIPVLAKHGFAGKVWSSAATRDLAAILLPDAGHLQEEEARFANKHRFAKHRPALCLLWARALLGPLIPLSRAPSALARPPLLGHSKRWDRPREAGLQAFRVIWGPTLETALDRP